MSLGVRSSLSDRPFAPHELVRVLGTRPSPVYVVRQSGLAAGGKATLAVLERFEGAAKADDEHRQLASEARRIATLASPNLARVRDVSARGDDLVVLGEFVEGEKLDALWRPEKLPLEIALRIVIDVLAGVGALHNLRDARQQPMNLAHGELSPVTIVLGLDGIARVLHAVARRDAGVVPDPASLPYLAPEVATGERYDARADVFGAGVLLWEALSGKRLFAGSDAVENARQVRAAPLPLANVPAKAAWAKGLVEVAARALAGAPDDRWPTAAVMAAEVRKAAGLKLAPASTAAAFAKSAFGERVKARREAMETSRPSQAPKAVSAAPMAMDTIPAPAPTSEPPFEDLEMESVIETVMVAPGIRATVADVVELESDAVIQVVPAIAPPPSTSSAPGGFSPGQHEVLSRPVVPELRPLGFVLDPFSPSHAPAPFEARPAPRRELAVVPEPAPPSITGAPRFAAAIDHEPPAPPPAPAPPPWADPVPVVPPPAPAAPAAPFVARALVPEPEELQLPVTDLQRRKVFILAGVAGLGLVILLLVVLRAALRPATPEPSAVAPPPTATPAAQPHAPVASIAPPPAAPPTLTASAAAAPVPAPAPPSPPQLVATAHPAPIGAPTSAPVPHVAPTPAPVRPRSKPVFDPNTL